MANIQIPQLSIYQYGLLAHTASAPVPIFLLPRPNRTDNHSQRYKMLARRAEVMSLIAMGLMEDASEEFAETVKEHAANTGCKFEVYGMTEQGYLLFKNCKDRAAN